MKESIIVIGAGAAGLMAAKKLSSFFNVTILEAANRIGGRIHSKVVEENIIESGAEFIHGDLPLTLKLLKKARIDYLPVKGNMYRKEKGALVIQNEMLPGWNRLLKKMKKLQEDEPLEQFLEKTFPGERNKQFKNSVFSYAEGFDLADRKTVSVQSLYKEWSAESEHNYRIPAGYGSLISYLEQAVLKNDGKILLNKPVRNIEWRKNKVTVFTDSGEAFEAGKILITVPLGMLRPDIRNAGNYLSFLPDIPAYSNAAKDIGFGNVVKITLKFHHAFWKPDTGFIFSGQEYFPTWWTKLPGITAMLTGWTGGPNASKLSDYSHEDILQKALESLSLIFDRPVSMLREELDHAELFNWGKDINTGGGYSYDTIKSAAAKKIMSKPISDTIFFAGEALYSGKHPGTVEAALASGKKVASQVIKRIK
jgi:monoamine oxidase